MSHENPYKKYANEKIRTYDHRIQINLSFLHVKVDLVRWPLVRIFPITTFLCLTNLIKAALLVCSLPLALSFEIIWLYFCWCFKLKITNQNSQFNSDQSETGTNLISRNFFVYSILAWARSVKNFPSLKNYYFRFSHIGTLNDKGNG